MELFYTKSYLTKSDIDLEKLHSVFVYHLDLRQISERNNNLRIKKEPLGNVYPNGTEGTGYIYVYFISSTLVYWRISVIKFGEYSQIAVSWRDVDDRSTSPLGNTKEFARWEYYNFMQMLFEDAMKSTLNDLEISGERTVGFK